MMKKKPRVIIDTFQLYYAMTGIGTYIHQLCLGLEEEKELKAEYLFFPDWRPAKDSNFFKKDLGFGKKVLNHLALFFWKQFVLPIFALVKRADFIVSSDFVGPAAPIRARNIVGIHDTFFWDFPENYPRIWRKYFKTQVNLGLKKDSIILALTEYTKSRVTSVLAPPCPIEVLHPAPKFTEFSSFAGSALIKKNLKNVPYFLHVGIFDRRKNIQTIVRAFSLFRKDPENLHFKLVLVGSKARGSYHDDYEIVSNLITQLNLSEAVIMTGFLSDEELSEMYHSAFSFIFPSLDEGFGIPVLEAFNARIPLIISNRGALSEVAGGAALIFDALDPRDLSEKMGEIKSAKIRAKLIEGGLERVKDFSKEKFAQDLDRIVVKYAKA